MRFAAEFVCSMAVLEHSCWILFMLEFIYSNLDHRLQCNGTRSVKMARFPSGLLDTVNKKQKEKIVQLDSAVLQKSILSGDTLRESRRRKVKKPHTRPKINSEKLKSLWSAGMSICQQECTHVIANVRRKSYWTCSVARHPVVTLARLL